MRNRTRATAARRMSAEARRESILNTTIGFIAQFGFWGFTIRDVAEAEHITEAGLLYYFKGKEDLLVEAFKYADRINQIAIADRLGVGGVTGEVLTDGIAYHCDCTLRDLMIAGAQVNVERPEIVRLYMLLESEALSADHPLHAYFRRREENLLKEYTFTARREGRADPERVAVQFLSAMEGLQLRWLNEANDLDLVAESHAIADLILP